MKQPLRNYSAPARAASGSDGGARILTRTFSILQFDFSGRRERILLPLAFPYGCDRLPFFPGRPRSSRRALPTLLTEMLPS